MPTQFTQRRQRDMWHADLLSQNCRSSLNPKNRLFSLSTYVQMQTKHTLQVDSVCQAGRHSNMWQTYLHIYMQGNLFWPTQKGAGKNIFRYQYRIDFQQKCTYIGNNALKYFSMRDWLSLNGQRMANVLCKSLQLIDKKGVFGMELHNW